MTIPPFLQKYGVYLAIVFGVIVALTLTYCQGQKAGKSGEVVKSQGRTIQTQREVGAANEHAAAARVLAAAEAIKQERELKDALNATTDPARRRVLRGCIIMRQQGRDTKDIPACSGPSADR